MSKNSSNDNYIHYQRWFLWKSCLRIFMIYNENYHLCPLIKIVGWKTFAKSLVNGQFLIKIYFNILTVLGIELKVVLNWGGVELRKLLNWGGFGFELRGFWCWTQGFSVWNWGVCWSWGCVELSEVLTLGVFGVELRDFRCGTEGCVELRGVLNWGGLNWWVFDVELRDFRCWTERCVQGFLGLKRSGPLCWTEGDPFRQKMIINELDKKFFFVKLALRLFICCTRSSLRS